MKLHCPRGARPLLLSLGLGLGLGLPFAAGAAGAAPSDAQAPHPPQAQGGGPATGPAARQGAVHPFHAHALPPGADRRLGLSAQQRSQVAALEVEMTAALQKILTPDQIALLAAMHPPRPPRGFGRGAGAMEGGPGGPEGDRGGGGPGGAGPGGPDGPDGPGASGGPEGPGGPGGGGGGGQAPGNW